MEKYFPKTPVKIQILNKQILTVTRGLVCVIKTQQKCIPSLAAHNHNRTICTNGRPSRSSKNPVVFIASVLSLCLRKCCFMLCCCVFCGLPCYWLWAPGILGLLFGNRCSNGNEKFAVCSICVTISLPNTLMSKSIFMLCLQMGLW